MIGISSTSAATALNPTKPSYWEMNPTELSKATEDFEKPFIIDESRPSTSAEQGQWERVRRKRGDDLRSARDSSGFRLAWSRICPGESRASPRIRRITRSRLIALVLTEALAAER